MLDQTHLLQGPDFRVEPEGLDLVGLELDVSSDARWGNLDFSRAVPARWLEQADDRGPAGV